MAAPERKGDSSGRVPPKGGPAKPTKPNPPTKREPDPDKPVAIGRRPSSPGFLLLVGVMWLAVGVICFFNLHTSWRLIPSIFAVGVGVMFSRGAFATVLRREKRRSTER